MSKLSKLTNRAKRGKPSTFDEGIIKNFTQKVEETGIIETVPTAKIITNPANDYRENDSEESIISLAEDISRQGLLHNLVVSEKMENGETLYLLISGERRLKAIRLLIDRETQKVKNGEKGDPGKYSTVNCRVVKGLTPRQEMIMLDAANLQTRGGAGDEAATRKAMARYRENVMAEYSLTPRQVREIIVDMSPMGFTTVNSNFIIEDNLRAELKAMLDGGELNKKQALALAKLSPQGQKLASDRIFAVKAACTKNGQDYSMYTKQALQGFLDACEQRTDKDTLYALDLAVLRAEKIRRQINGEKEGSEQKRTVKRAQRDVLLRDCAVIQNKIKKLSSPKTVANIRRFDSAAEDENLKIATKIDEIIAELTQLKENLKGQ